MNEPTDKVQYLSVADQCAATASNDITALILVDGGSGTLRELINDAADAIRAGWRAQPTASGEVVGWLPVHSNGHKFYGAPLKTEAEAKQYINQVHQSSDSVTLIARPFTWIATPPTQGADSVLEDAARYRWLRENWFTMSSNYRRCITFKVGEPRWSDITEEELDAAIDAARKQGGE